MIRFLRGIGRALVFLVLVALALAGLALAVFSIGSGDSALGLSALADHVQLASARDAVGGWLDDVEAGGSVADWSALGGALAIAAGLLLLAAAILPQRERTVTLEATEDGGQIAARRKPLSQAATALAARQPGITDATSRITRGWLSASKLAVRADRARYVSNDEARKRVTAAVEPLASPFSLRPRVNVRLGEGSARVQ